MARHGQTRSLLVLVHFGVFGVHHLFLALTAARAAGGAVAGGPAGSRRARTARRGLFVHFLADLLRGPDQVLGGRPDGVQVVALHRLAGRFDLFLDLVAILLADLVAVFGEELLDAIDSVVGLVADLYQLALLLVFRRVGLGVLDHLVDLVLVQAAGRGDPDRLLFLRRQVLGPDVDDAVRVDVEGDFDLGHAARRGWDADKVEVAQRLVVGRHLPLALQDVDRHRRLAVRGGGEDLALLRRDGRVALDETREHAAQGLDAEGQRRDVQQQNVLHLAFQYAALDCRADCDDLVRVHALVRLLADELAHELDDLGHAGHAADQHDFAEVLGRDSRVGQDIGEVGLVSRMSLLPNLIQLDPECLGRLTTTRP